MKKSFPCLFIAALMVSFYGCGNQDEPTDKGNKIDTTGSNIYRDTLNRPLPSAPIDTPRKGRPADSGNRKGQ